MARETMQMLIQQAVAMLRDRSKEEAALIYYVAKMDNEERSAIILGYQLMKGWENDEARID